MYEKLCRAQFILSLAARYEQLLDNVENFTKYVETFDYFSFFRKNGQGVFVSTLPLKHFVFIDWREARVGCGPTNSAGRGTSQVWPL